MGWNVKKVPAIAQVAGREWINGADGEMASGCQRQDVSAYEMLYRTHGARMRSVAHSMLGNREDAEDAVQETFLKVYRSVHGYQGQASFATWVFRILINTCRDAARGRMRRAEVPGERLELHAARPASPALSLALERALAGLNPRYREVFLLAESEGFTHPEIAAVLDIPEGTSRSWLYEAKRALRQALPERI